jgi:hypothetical protein
MSDGLCDIVFYVIVAFIHISMSVHSQKYIDWTGEFPFCDSQGYHEAKN